MKSETLRLGGGAGFSADRVDAARQLVEKGALDYIIFECIAERTLALGHQERKSNPDKGYTPWLERRFEAVLPLCAENGTRVITNMGVANPPAAARRTLEIAKKLGLSPFRVAHVEGDDVAHLISSETELPELGCTVGDVDAPMIAANAYLGVEAILPSLDLDVPVIITGRVADPSLFVAPMVHTFGWRLDDWPRLGSATVVGHLLECAAQVTGGYFADPGVKHVPDLAYVGFPLAEVSPDGSAVITKVPEAGGCVTLQTVREQLLYEVHDPAAYISPDVIADFSTTQLQETGPDRIEVRGAGGHPRPDQLKVTVAFDGGYAAEAEISYAGPGAQERARLAGEIVAERMRHVHKFDGDLRIDLIGVNALHGSAVDRSSSAEDVRLRVTLRTPDRDRSEQLLWEVCSLLTCGPAGGGGYRGTIDPCVVTYSAFVPRESIKPRVEVLEA